MDIQETGGTFAGEAYGDDITPIEAARQWVANYYGGARAINEAEFTQVNDVYYFMIEDGVSTYRMEYRTGTAPVNLPRWMVWRI